MKMRKILSFVLVLSLVLGSFSMAFAATPAQAGLSDIDASANKEAIQVNFDLGIVTGNPDGTFLPAKTVTRAEFAAMITRALAVPTSALAGYSATSFKDTNGYAWAVPYLAFCQSKGIMLGDGAGNAMPGKTITVNEAMAMSLRAIGYTSNSAQLVGSWPSNYVTLAQNLDLYTDVAALAGVDKANAAQIIYNTLTVQKVAVNADGETVALWKDAAKTKASSLMNTGLGATMTEAVVNPSDDSLINAVAYAGVYGEIYRNSDNEIVAVKPIGTTLTGSLKANDGTTAIFKVDGVEYTLPATGGAAKVTIASTAGLILKNGVAGTATATNTVTVSDAALTADDNDVTLNVKVSGKTVKEIYSISTWKADRAEVVTATDLEQIKSKKLIGGKFAENDDKNIDLKAFTLVGVASLDKIAKDNVVYVYYNNSTDKEIKKIAVGTAVVSGKITEVDGSDFYVAGKVYNVATVINATTETPKAGDEVKLTLDAYGDVFKYEKTSGTTDKYGVIMEGATVAIDGSKAKVYTKDADDSKVFMYNTTVTTKGAVGVATTATGLVAYGLDKDGKINAIERGAKIGVNITTAALKSSKVLEITSVSGTSQYAIDANVVVFTSNNTTYGEVDLTTIDKVDISTLSAPFEYILDDNKVVAMVVLASEAQKSGDDFYGVFDKIVNTVDANDDPAYKLTGFINGKAATGVQSYDDSNITGFDKTKIQVFEVKYTGELVKSISVTTGSTNTTTFVTAAAFANDKTTIQDTASKWYGLSKNVVVYEATETDGDYTYTVSSATSIAKDDHVWFYNLDADDTDANRGYDVVIFVN